MSRWLMVVGGCGYSLGAATTTPFTFPADVMAGAPILAMAALIMARWPWHTEPARSGGEPVSGWAPPHPYLPWVLLLSVVTGWELFNYLAHGSRADHPTLSSMTDAVDGYYPLKAMLFFGWLSLGWLVVRRGSRAVAS
jgi:hypothetical protein